MLLLTVPCVLLLFSMAFAYKDEHCCCGCPYPCPISIPARCGAAPTTPCHQKEYFNASELLSPCDLIIKLHDLTAGVIRDTAEEHTGQPVSIGKDKKKPNSVTVTNSSSSTSKDLPSIFSKLFGFPKFSFPSFSQGKVVKNETKIENGTWIRETVRTIPNGTEITRITMRNETDPKEARARWHRIMSDMKHGIGRIDDGFTNMQHGLIDSFDSLFKGVVDGVFGFLRAAR